MAAYRKVLWTEGIILGQQHFQQWERYYEHNQRLTQQHTQPLHWGIVELNFNENYLSQGTIALTRCLALLSDRRWVDFRTTDDGDHYLQLDEHETRPILHLYLSLPYGNETTGITGYPKPEYKSPAWHGTYETIHDIHDPSREREVLFGQQNILLTINPENHAHHEHIKLAELCFDPRQGIYQINDQYIPPTLAIAASRGLSNWLTRISHKLRKCLHKLQENQAQAISETKLALHLNLNKLLTSYLVRFSALEKKQQLHPINVYDTTLGLIGELNGCCDNQILSMDIPGYHQKALTTTFTDLETLLDKFMKEVMPKSNVRIALNQINTNQWITNTLQEHDLKNARFCLVIKNDGISQPLINQVIQEIRVASPSQLEMIMNSFTNGVPLNYVHTPARDLLPQKNHHYFELNKQSGAWQKIIVEKQIAFFIRDELSHLEFDLIRY